MSSLVVQLRYLASCRATYSSAAKPMLEAADEIERLTIERDRMRAALRELVEVNERGSKNGAEENRYYDSMESARRALEPSTKEA